MSTALTSAVRRGVIPSNPIERVEWRNPTRSPELDISTVPAPADVTALADDVGAEPGEGRRMFALFAVVGMAGLRPSEAAGLLVKDVALPSEGWGLATVRGAITALDGRFTTDGAAVEQKGLEHRAHGALREAPLAPDLVRRLRSHLEVFPPQEGRVFSNSAANYSPVRIRARERHWPEGHPLRTSRLCDLRHAAVTQLPSVTLSPTTPE